MLTTFVDLVANYETAKQAAVQPTPVEGVGEEAYWDTNRFLMAARGEDFFVTVVFASRGNQAPLIEQSKQILAAMLDHL